MTLLLSLVRLSKYELAMSRSKGTNIHFCRTAIPKLAVVLASKIQLRRLKMSIKYVVIGANFDFCPESRIKKAVLIINRIIKFSTLAEIA